MEKSGATRSTASPAVLVTMWLKTLRDSKIADSSTFPVETQPRRILLLKVLMLWLLIHHFSITFITLSLRTSSMFGSDISLGRMAIILVTARARMRKCSRQTPLSLLSDCVGYGQNVIEFFARMDCLCSHTTTRGPRVG